jgi:hypothetical protein
MTALVIQLVNGNFGASDPRDDLATRRGISGLLTLIVAANDCERH